MRSNKRSTIPVLIDPLETRRLLSATHPALIDLSAPAPSTTPVEVGDQIYYFVDREDGSDLWSTSRKTAQSNPVARYTYQSLFAGAAAGLAVAHGTLYALVPDQNSTGVSLIRILPDGASERLVTASDDITIVGFIQAGDRLYLLQRTRSQADGNDNFDFKTRSEEVSLLVVDSPNSPPRQVATFTTNTTGYFRNAFGPVLGRRPSSGVSLLVRGNDLFFSYITGRSTGITASQINTSRSSLFFFDAETEQLVTLDQTASEVDFRGQTNGSSFATLGVAGNYFYYLAGQRGGYSDQPQRNAGLWRSDGTPEGTTLVAANLQGLTIDTSTVVRAGDRLFFIAEGTDGRSLYSTDGTAEGTGKVLLKAAGRAAIPASRLNASVTRTIQLLDGEPVLPVQVGRAVQFWNITATTRQGGSLAADISVVATLPSGSSLVEYTTNNDQLAFTTQRGDFRQAFLAEAGFTRPLTPPTLIRGVPSASPSTDTLTLTDDTLLLDYAGIDANPVPSRPGLVAIQLAKPKLSITNIQTPRTAFAALGFPISYTLKNTGSDLAIAPDAARRVERIYLSTDRKLDLADRLLASLDSAHPTGSPAIVPAVSQVPAAIDMPSVPAGSAAVQTIPAHFVAAETADAGAVGQRFLIIVSEAYSSTFTGTLASTSQAVRPIRILPRNEPNLVLTLLGGPPPSAKPGDTVNLRLQFSNFGTSLFSTQRVGRPLNIDFDLVINQSRYDADTTSLDLTLKPGEFKALDVPFRIPDSANPQNYNLWITLDPDNILALTRDGRETSRSGSISIT